MKSKLITILTVTIFSFQSYGQGHRCKEDLFPVKMEENRKYGYQNLFGIWRIQPTFTLAKPFTGNCAIVLMGLKYGAVSCEGKIVIQPEYDEIKPFIGGRAWARKGDKWALLSDEGRVVVDARFTEVHDISRFRMQSWVKEDEKWSLISRETGKIMSPVPFDEYKTLIDSTSLVKVGERYGLLSHNSGNYIILPELEKVVKVAPYTMAFKKNGQWGLLKDFGNIILQPKYDTIAPKFKFRLIVAKGGKYGLVDLNGNPVTKVKYDEIDDFYEKAARVKVDDKFGFISFRGREVIPIEYEYADRFKNFRCIVKKGGRYGIINTKNEFILDNVYKEVRRNYDTPYYTVETDSGWLFLGIDTKLLFNTPFEKIITTDPVSFVRAKHKDGWAYFSVPDKGYKIDQFYNGAGEMISGHAEVVNEDGKKGVVDSLGTLVVPYEFDSIEYKWFGGQLFFQVRKSGVYGIYKSDGKVVVPVEYDLIARSDKATLKVRKGGKYGILSSSVRNMGETICELSYDYMSNSIEDRDDVDYPAVVEAKGKYGLITLRGGEVSELLPTKYKDGRYIGGNLFVFKKGKRCALINYKGQEKTDYDYDAIGEFSDKLIGFQKGKIWGYMNVNGKENIQAQFEEITPFNESVACVKKDGKWGVINRAGKFIITPEYASYKDESNKRFLVGSNGKTYSLDELFK